MQQKNFCSILFALGMLSWLLLTAGCQQPNSSDDSSLANRSIASSSGSGSSTTTTASSSSAVNQFQIITRADGSGSFDGATVPLAGGVAIKAARIFDLSGSLIPTSSIPNWFIEARAFLTSTRTAGTANPATPTTSDTPCAYFDSYSTDLNPDSSGYYTIDGYNTSLVTAGASGDVDQCAGTAASELNQLGLYIKLDRRFLNSTDKIQMIVTAKLIDAPNTAPTVSSCVTGGTFDPSSCSNVVYTISMRSGVGAAAKPFFYLFPSAKALDLLSENIFLPINNDSNITTLSIDRVKGGAIFYNIKVIRIQ